MTIGLLQAFRLAGHLMLDPFSALPALCITVAASTLVESLPITRWIDDNLSVPLTAAVCSFILLPRI